MLEGEPKRAFQLPRQVRSPGGPQVARGNAWATRPGGEAKGAGDQSPGVDRPAVAGQPPARRRGCHHCFES